MQVLGVIDRADAWEAVDFLNKRGGNVKFGKIAPPPSEEEWSKKGEIGHNEDLTKLSDFTKHILVLLHSQQQSVQIPVFSDQYTSKGPPISYCQPGSPNVDECL